MEVKQTPIGGKQNPLGVQGDGEKGKRKEK